MIPSAVWGFASNRVFLGGDNGESWRGPPFGSSQALMSTGFKGFQTIHGLPDGGSVFATADWAVLRLDGTSWTEMDAGPRIPSNGLLRGLAVVSETELWAAGTGGAVLHSGTAGVEWDRIDAGATENIRRVWANGPNDVWFIGQSGLVLRWNGTTFTKDYCPVCGDLWGIWGTGPDDVWLADSDGQLIYWDGGSYTPLANSPTSASSIYPMGLWGAGDRDLFMSINLPDGGGGALHYRR